MFLLLVWVTLFGYSLSDSRNQIFALAESKCGGKEKASALLDVASGFVNKAKNLYPECMDGSNCGKKETAFAFLDISNNLISQVKNNYPKCPITDCQKHIEQPVDCLEILQSGQNQSGVYTIWPKTLLSFYTSLRVYCDMDTYGGGWTVIQIRGNFSNPKDYFYRDWKNYKQGFGDVEEEFWIGNDNINAITNQAKYSIRFDLEDAKGETGFAHYDSFWIEDEDASYKLHIGGYTGNVGDAMSNNKGMKFSAKDPRKDGDCAVMRSGAWWYNGCTVANLNGLYQPGVESDRGITWQEWTVKWVSLAGVEMKMRPRMT